MNNTRKTLQHILNTAIDNKKIFGVSFCLKYKNEIWNGASGNLTTDSQYFIASATKLFTTSVVLNLLSKGLLDTDDKIEKHLDQNTIKGLHTLHQKDYASAITIKNLLAHTSGIPDYFQKKDTNGNSLEKELTAGNDQFWTFEQAIERSKTIKPLFAPSRKGKAHYSDTNFQLLGKIIENITGESVSQNFQKLIFNPLGLSKTYVYIDITDRKPKNIYYKNQELHIPKAMTSFGADGGIVSTSGEMMLFSEAFFNGAFFPKIYLNQLKEWNNIFFPMQSGIGIHRFKLPWIFNPLGTVPELIGHSGLSGALAFHNSEKDLYITGTVNQIDSPSTSFKFAIKLIQNIISK